ncbi:MAG: SDR family oxidoreductase [Cytophagales bacterium]|nr:SDR family oxidoreductase [Cytophagales bacterium]MDW8383312.1 SDR family oxidoreductase [Flammeovirgaceae bacterium]
MKLSDAKVLITGGSSGIGYETARQLKNHGAQVVICGRNRERLEKSAHELGVHFFRADVAIEKDVEDLVAFTVKTLGGFNTLINNAAHGYFSMLTEIDTQRFNELLATNVTGAMLVARETAKHFIANNYGNIVNISSTAGKAGFAGGTAYVASKFALAGMTECWRAELRKHNIRVMLVNPSEVQTNFAQNSGREPKEFNPTKLQATEVAHTILSMLQLNDVGFITEATIWATNPK